MRPATASPEVERAAVAQLGRFIRDVPDFPRAGVLFKDITPLLADAAGFAASIDALVAPWQAHKPDVVCGIEARGFIFGGALARALDVGFVPLRKPGKLPAATVGVDFALEYATARLEIHADAVTAGARVLVVDDVLATGGTLAAARQLLEQLGAVVAGAAVVVELDQLGGRARWPAGVPLVTLLHY